MIRLRNIAAAIIVGVACAALCFLVGIVLGPDADLVGRD